MCIRDRFLAFSIKVFHYHITITYNIINKIVKIILIIFINVTLMITLIINVTIYNVLQTLNIKIQIIYIWTDTEYIKLHYNNKIIKKCTIGNVDYEQSRGFVNVSFFCLFVSRHRQRLLAVLQLSLIHI